MIKICIIAILLLLSSGGRVLAQRAEDGKKCQVDFEPSALKLDGGVNFAEATYTFDDNCKPILIETRRAAVIPVGARRGSKGSGNQSNSANAEATLTGKIARASGATGSSCTVYLWEEDVIQVKTIGFENFTSWSMDGGAITDAQVTGRSYHYLDWWFNDTPNVTISYIDEPYSAQSSASAHFYCQGVGPVSNYVCGNTPAYEIVLQGNVIFDGGGNCSGTARYSGAVIPAGRVRFQVTRN